METCHFLCCERLLFSAPSRQDVLIEKRLIYECAGVADLRKDQI